MSNSISKIVKGDSFILECDIQTNITGWKIRCEIYDVDYHKVKLATANSGGSDDQIEITDASNGIFLIKVPAGSTTLMNDKSKIEIEVETSTQIGGANEVITPFQGDIDFKEEQITWSEPN